MTHPSTILRTARRLAGTTLTAALVAVGLVAATAAPELDAQEPLTLEQEALGPWQGPPEFSYAQTEDLEPTREVGPEQASALDAFLEAHPNAVARWDDGSGSLAVLYGFASDPSAAGPESAARSFLSAHADLFGGLDVSALELDPMRSREALGGSMLRFDQTHQGLPVLNAGVGVVMDGDGRVRAVSGPVYPGLSLDTSPSLTADRAVAAAAADLETWSRDLPTEAVDYLTPSWQAIEDQLGPLLTTPHPELSVYPTPEGARLAWEMYYWSRNPFGLFRYVVDAHGGEVLERANFVRTATGPSQIPTPARVAEATRLAADGAADGHPAAGARAREDTIETTADVFPSSPPVTTALQADGTILGVDGDAVSRPLGQVRVTLRKFDASNTVTGTEDELTGTHAVINSALPTKQPFGQAALNTYHFDRDSLPLKGRTEEVDHLEEPAEHQDAISQFFYITSFMEYLDYLHKEGDAVHNRGVGEGDFPNSYPNESNPLTGTVHIANVLAPPEDPTAENFVRQLLGLDNAFAVPFSDEVAGQPVVVNPTAYGHGYLFNDLGIDFAVPLHEGTHATITPIAGFEGSPEGGALNEGQADVWAYTIGENPTLGGYIAAGFRIRDLIREEGGNPDAFQWLRHAESQLRYTQLGIRSGSGFEVHRDGEIYASAMWDLRQLLMAQRPGGSFLRPDPISGEAEQPTSTGKETFERLFLGSMYVLGTMSPDNFVGARDATIIADDVLYPSDPTDLDAPGRHRALIEHVFANRELGLNAAAPQGGRQTVSSAVSAFTAEQASPAAPQNVTAVPSAEDEIVVSWDPVDGAQGYAVLKRRSGTEGQRLLQPGDVTYGNEPVRAYFEGDAALSGFTHVEYVLGGGTSHVDEGQWFGRHPGLGLETPHFDYTVRALGENAAGQVGFSDLSGTAEVALEATPVTDFVETEISDVSFDGTIFAFDQTLENLGGAGSFDGTIFEPVTFKVIEISDSTVTVANADNGGTGQNGDEAHFVYGETLSPEEVSAPRRLEFHDPEGRLFTFDAVVTGHLRVQPTAATGSQDPVDTADPTERPETFGFTEEFTGVVPIGTAGLQVGENVDYVEVDFTARASAESVTGTLSADPSAGVYPDLDFELRDAQGNVLSTSATFGPNEQVGTQVEGGQTYTYRVIGWANAPTTFRIVSEQRVSDPADANEGTSGSEPTDPETLTGLVRFTVDPLNGIVDTEVLQIQ